MFYMVYGLGEADAKRIRAEQRENHFAYLVENEKSSCWARATLADESDARTGSLLVINVASHADVDAFAPAEPYKNNAGLFFLYGIAYALRSVEPCRSADKLRKQLIARLSRAST